MTVIVFSFNFSPGTSVVLHKLAFLEELESWVATHVILLSQFFLHCGIYLSYPDVLLLQLLGRRSILWLQPLAVPTPVSGRIRFITHAREGERRKRHKKQTHKSTYRHRRHPPG
ncbi:hypothetical protein E2C01_013823 [Portunus trituberculatus]|uniref:Uncharacterized protein n=1 Tax=Portunus trituberculatus TaxID=210409 RepID=A0A5B7DH94_PORTR|nr:hypothetical protein [Portunus trituberculatus]